MMNKEISCYIVSDLLPLYQEDILSEETKKDIEKHLNECKEFRKKLDLFHTVEENTWFRPHPTLKL